MRALRLVLAACLTLIAGCASIPVEGPVEEVLASQNPAGVDIAPEPPSVGASPSRLADGFLLAMADPTDDYAVARAYLTQAASDSWEPREAIVYDGMVEATNEGASVVGYQLGTLDAIGRYAMTPASFEWNLGLVKEGDEWRISKPPEGLLLSRYLFSRNYRTANVYFMDRAWEKVVPELVHVPEAELTPQSIVEALLAGPSSSMSAALGTAIPSGVTLSSRGATINSAGVVSVDLTNQAGKLTGLSDDVWRRIGAQLLWSLTSLDRVTGLEVSVDGLAVALPGANASGALELATQQGYQVLSQTATPDLYGVRDSRPGRLSSTNTFLSWSDPGEPVSQLAISLNGASAALISSAGDAVLLGSPEGPWSRVATPYTELADPQFVGSAVWALGTSGQERKLIAVTAAGEANEVEVAVPAGARLVSYAVSPTGTRIALVISFGARLRLGVATVSPGQVLRLGQWQELPLQNSSGTHLDGFSAVAWTQETTLAVIASADQVASVYSIRVDGSAIEDLGSITTAAVDLTALPRLGGGSIAALSDTGVTWRYEARTRWGRATDELTSIAYAN